MNQVFAHVPCKRINLDSIGALIRCLVVTDFVPIIDAFDFLGTDQLSREGFHSFAVCCKKLKIKKKFCF